MIKQEMLEKAGRLSSGPVPLHIRRKGLSDVIEECRHTLTTMLNNWPNEYELPADHDLHELMEVMGIVATGLGTKEKDNAPHVPP